MTQGGASSVRKRPSRGSSEDARSDKSTSALPGMQTGASCLHTTFKVRSADIGWIYYLICRRQSGWQIFAMMGEDDLADSGIEFYSQ
jgi:hypothetical protein